MTDSHSVSRITMLEPWGSGGIHIYAVRLADALALSGIRVSLVTGRNASPLPDATFEQAPILEDFFVPRIEPPLLRRARSMSEHMRNRGRFERAVVGASPELVHAQWPLTRFGVDVFERIAKRVPLVITAHNAIPHDCDDRRVLRYWGRIYGTADAVVCHSSETKREIEELFGERLKCRLPIIPLGAGGPSWEVHSQPTREQARSLLDLPSNPTVLFFGAIRQYKGLDLLVAAWKQVLASMPHARLLVAGQGSPWASIADTAHSLGISESVIARIQWVPDAEIAAYMRSADVVALPYRKVDGSAVAVDAALHGIPMVMSDIPGFRALWSDDEVLFSALDSESLAASILNALTDGDASDARAKAAHARYVARNSWSACAEQHRALYDSLFEERSR